MDHIMEEVKDTVIEGADSMMVEAEVGEEPAIGLVAKVMVLVGIIDSMKMMMD